MSRNECPVCDGRGEYPQGEGLVCDCWPCRTRGWLTDKELARLIAEVEDSILDGFPAPAWWPTPEPGGTVPTDLVVPF